MLVIGEKINGFIPKTFAAIKARDEFYIRELAKAQVDSGADYLDICAGTVPAEESDVLGWLIRIVQNSVDVPLSIDSPDPQTIIEMMGLTRRPGIVNSVSLEKGKCETLLPVIADSDWKVVMLTCDADGIPESAHDKYGIAARMIEMARDCGIAQERLFIDPLATTLATNPFIMDDFAQTVRLVKERYPNVNILSGTSNISLGMPCRKAITAQFLTLAMAAGLDAAIMDPLSSDMQTTLYATDALLGNDELYRNYLEAYRKGLFSERNG